MKNPDDFIVQEYAKNRSANSIGKEIGKDHHFVIKTLIKNGVSIRSKPDSHRAAHPFVETEHYFNGDRVYKSTRSNTYFIFYPYGGRKLRRPIKQIVCSNCGKSSFVSMNKAKNHVCSDKCRYILQSGPLNVNWKGFTKVRKCSGHILRYAPEHPFARANFVYEHRLVMEEKLGRFLRKDEVVHHINGVKTDNRIENLCLCSVKEHINAHASVGKLLKELLDRKIVFFDEQEKIYKMR